jgi:ADP-dependent NAD(P)H-hydrate dehydratase / NAD(P)H-hydrate epimerase
MKSGTKQSINRVDLSDFYRTRRKQSRKGDFGRVIVVGGSGTYAGCLVFNALAALRAGADLSIVVAPRRAADIVACYSPDLITVPCNTQYPEPGTTKKELDRADALVIGCGVERTSTAHNALLSIIKACRAPIVADAESLHAISSAPNIGKNKRLLLTPNAGEFQILSGNPWPSTRRDRVEATRNLARKFSATVIVKGAEDVISDGQRVSIDLNGSAYMTKGGYGDLVAGVAGAVLARGFDQFDAARVAAYVVGRAGEIASSKFGEGTLASDTLSEIPAIIANG